MKVETSFKIGGFECVKSLKKVNILAGPKLFFVSQPSWSTTFATRSFSGQGSYLFCEFC